VKKIHVVKPLTIIRFMNFLVDLLASNGIKGKSSWLILIVLT